MKNEDLKNEILKRCYQIAQRHFENPKLILYGSRARGDEAEDSDWDILVITKSKITRDDIDNFRNEVYEFELEAEQIISTIVVNYYDWNKPVMKATPLYQNIEKDGIKYGFA